MKLGGKMKKDKKESYRNAFFFAFFWVVVASSFVFYVFFLNDISKHSALQALAVLSFPSLIAVAFGFIEWQKVRTDNEDYEDFY